MSSIPESNVPEGQERRAFGRRRSRVHALLLVPGRPPSPCVVRNWSPAGAMLELCELIDPPFNVKLRLFGTDDELACEVRHVRQYRMGVRFTEVDATEVFEVAIGISRRGRRRPQPTSEPMTTRRRMTDTELRKRVLDIVS